LGVLDSKGATSGTSLLNLVVAGAFRGVIKSCSSLILKLRPYQDKHEHLMGSARVSYVQGRPVRVNASWSK